MKLSLTVFLFVSVLFMGCSSDDSSKPSAAITAPASDASVSGTVPIQVDAVDDKGIAKVNAYFRAKGANRQGVLAGSAVSKPYLISWSTSRVPNLSELEIVAVPQDFAGNTAQSDPVRVRVNNANVPSLSYLVAYNIPKTTGAMTTSAGGLNSGLPVGLRDFQPTSIAAPTVRARITSGAGSVQPQAANDFSSILEWAWQPFGSADGYGVYSAQNFEGPYTVNGKQFSSTGTGLQKRSSTIPTALPGDSYYGLVTAITNNQSLEGGFSNADSATFLPAQFSASPSDGQSVPGGKPTLSWTSNAGSSVEGYLYFVYGKDPLLEATTPVCTNSPNSTAELAVVYPVASTACPAGGLPSGTYYWWVAGVSFDAKRQADGFSFSQVRRFVVP